MQSELFVKNPQIAVAIASDGIRPQGADFLRDDSDVSFLAAVIGKAVVAEAVVEPAEQHDIMLQPDIRTPPAAAPATTKAPAVTASTAKAAVAATSAKATSASERGSSMAAAGKTRRSAMT